MFALIHNNAVKVGPRDWKWSIFYQYLVDNSLDTTALSRSEPSEPIVTDSWKILPVTFTTPDIDTPFEQLSGPTLTINSDSVSAVYETAPESDDSIKSKLKDLVAANRFVVEIGGLSYTFGDGTTSIIDTSRAERTKYVETLTLSQNDATISYKFKNLGWKTLSKEEFQTVVQACSDHVQAVFQWEKDKSDSIDACTTIEEFKAIEVRHTSQIPE